MQEEWRTIEEFPQYEISNIGRVRHKKHQKIRKILNPNSTCPTVTLYNGKIITKSVNNLMLATWGFSLTDDNIKELQQYAAERTLTKITNKYSMDIEDIINNREGYEIIVIDNTDKTIKNKITIDEFERMFNGDKQMFIDYLRVISTGKTCGGTVQEQWNIRKIYHS